MVARGLLVLRATPNIFSTQTVTYCHEDFIHIHRCLRRRLHEQQAVVICICLCILETITEE